MGSRRSIPSEAPQVFRYSDYRGYLKAYFAHRKAEEPGFSLRTFSRHPELGLSSSSFLSAVLKGGKNLSQSLRLRIGRALGLGPAEQEYFETMIQADQSRTAGERAHFQARLARLAGAGAQPLAEAGQLFYSQWWYALVWHWISLHPGRSNPVRIAKAIRPRLEPAQVEEAIRTLSELKLIKRLANGYAVTARHLAAGPGMGGAMSSAWARDFLGLAAGGLSGPGDDAPPYGGALSGSGARAYHVLTFTLGARGVGQLRAKLAALGAEVRELAAEDEAEGGTGARVYALALQLFPCSEEVDAAEAPSDPSPAGRGTTAELSLTAE